MFSCSVKRESLASQKVSVLSRVQLPVVLGVVQLDGEVGRHVSTMKTCLTIKPLSTSRHQEFIQFIYREFFPREPLALASGLAGKTNPKTIETFTQWMNQGLCLVAIDSQSNQIVAAALNCFLNQSEVLFNNDYSCMEEEDACIWKFLDHLETGYDVFQQLQVDRGMELVFLCVQQAYTGLGLARRLTEETITTARRLEIPFIKSNPSTPVTCHLFESLGFETINEMKLVDYQVDGEIVFRNARPEDTTRLCIKKMLN